MANGNPENWLADYMKTASRGQIDDLVGRLYQGAFKSPLLQDATVVMPSPAPGLAQAMPAKQHPLPEHMRDMVGSFGNRPTYFAKLLMRLGWYDDGQVGDYMHIRGKLQIVAVTDPLNDGLGPAVFVIGNGKPMALRDSSPELFPSDGFVTKLKMLENPA